MNRQTFAVKRTSRSRFRAPALALGALMLAGLFFWQLERAEDRYPSRNIPRLTATTTTRNTASVPARARLPDAPPIGSLTAPTSATITPPQQLAIHAAAERLGPLSSAQLEWLSAHGYLDLPDHSDITAAELQRLHAEAVSGATAAIHRYAAVAAVRGEADAISWLQRSAAHGSTQALLRIAVWHSRRETTAQATDSAIAWLLVAQQRGDPFADDMIASISDRGITPAIEQLAGAFYRELENDRYQHGLPAFDNRPFPTDVLRRRRSKLVATLLTHSIARRGASYSRTSKEPACRHF